MSETEALFGVLRQSADGRCAAAIEGAVANAPDHELCRVNALAFAAKNKLDEERIIAAFLHAARLGLFELSWNVLCPACGGVLALRSLCDGHHKKALFIAELGKKSRAFLTEPALAGISSDLMQSQEATDDCRRRPIGLCAHAQIRDDSSNMETYHEVTYRSSRVGHADCGPDIRSPG